MKKILLILLLATTFIVPVYATTGSASAVNAIKVCSHDNFTGNAKGELPDVCKDVNNQSGKEKDNPIIKIIRAALEIVSWVAGVAAIILILISGMKFMTAGGDPQGVKSARSHLVHALIGVVIIVIAQAILYLAIGTTS